MGGRIPLNLSWNSDSLAKPVFKDGKGMQCAELSIQSAITMASVSRRIVHCQPVARRAKVDGQ